MAATEFSFDIVSKADPQEVKNAIGQAEKEIETRYDFRNVIAEIKHEKETLTLHAENEALMTALVDVVQSKLIKRGIDIRLLEYGKLEEASKGTVRQVVTIKNGLSTDVAKKVTKLIKDKGLKVTTQIQDAQVRVTSKSKDELQSVMNVLKASDIDVPFQYINYR